MGKSKIELLAPASSLEGGRVALSAGADAVYIGAPMFGARSSAGVSIEDISTLCTEAHQYGAKVYVALNTILTDSELPQAVSIAHQLYTAGADALIIQDMGLLLQDLPPIPLHASTQCHNDTSEKVKLLEELGFEQVVLPRELSSVDMERVKGDSKVRIESFVHGALCVSYSGRCFISEACQGRSANRGSCAQYCRMSYDLEDAEGNKLREGQHLLSLRDLNRTEIIEEMLDSGVHSLKIEGRLKGIDYVRNVTAHYREVVDEIIARRSDDYVRSSRGIVKKSFTPTPEATFSRRYTAYNTPMHTPIPVESITTFTNKSVGEEIGKLLRNMGKEVEIMATKEVTNGDGLLFVSCDERATAGAFVNQVTPITGKKNTYRIKLSQMIDLAPGATLYRNLNHTLSQILTRSDASVRRVPIDITCTANPQGIQLRCGKVFVERHIPLEPAQRDNSSKVANTIGKLGDTPFTLGHLTLSLGGLYLPPSVMTEMRRELAEGIMRDNDLSAHTERDEVGKALIDVRNSFLSRSHMASDYGLPDELDYTYNVANKSAEHFYRILGVAGNIVPALEVEKPVGEIPVMYTRHCLMHQIGYCTREGKNPPFKLPLYLVRGKQRFRVTTNCKECQMTVWSDEDSF